MTTGERKKDNGTAIPVISKRGRALLKPLMLVEGGSQGRIILGVSVNYVTDCKHRGLRD